MNAYLMSLEISVLGLGLVLMLADLFMPADRRQYLAYAAIAALSGLLLISFSGFGVCSLTGTAFNGMFVEDALAVFFKRLFILAAILVLFISAQFADRLGAAIAEYYSLIIFALAGMLFAASANDFSMLFVSIELITISFYVLVSFQRSRLVSLEAGVKYLILGALSSAFMVFGIALIWGTTGKLNFNDLALIAAKSTEHDVFLLGILMVIVGLGFKIAAFPFQIWAPDVYQGAPTPTTAFLAIGSKAAGFVLLLRVLFVAFPVIAHNWVNLLITISAITILYGNLCAIPQRNIKRLLGYSSISHAGYLLLGVAAIAGNVHNPVAGGSAILYYLAGYLFTVLASFAVIALVVRGTEAEDISVFAGLHQRSPLLAAALTIAMVSLAGIPPLAGFFGKFLLLKSVIELGPLNQGYYCLAFVALAGVIISMYYYFGVVRAIYFSKEPKDLSPIIIPGPSKFCILVCLAGIFWLGIFPNTVLNLAAEAAKVLGS
jgi:NADH-quinone oxidoreductase subunit N